jgi:structural maintenance of chromosome 2
MQLGNLVKKLEQDLEAAKQVRKEKQMLYDNCSSSIKKLEKSIKDHSSQREARLKDLDKSIKSIKTQMQSASKKLKVCILSSYFICSICLVV